MASYDVEPPFERLINVLAPLTVGNRTDWIWAGVSPPLQVGPHRMLTTTLALDVVAVAPRHVGLTWEAREWPMHVYVCRVIDPSKAMARNLHAEDLSIEYWAVVTALDNAAPRDIRQH